MPNTIEI